MNRLGNKGRLGNQMFQYASLVGIAKHLNYDHCIPNHSNVDFFHQNINGTTVTVNHQLQHLFKLNHLNGRFGIVDGYEIDVHQHEFCEELFNECPDNSTLYGHFESYKYFQNAENEVRSDYTFKDDLLEVSKKFHEDNKLNLPVCITVRRGDFIKFQDHHSPCTEEYYFDCIKTLGVDRQYLIVSDDIEWCKKIFIGSNYSFVDIEKEEIRKAHLDMCIGSLCSDFIIANSTFSWWIAFLGIGKNKKVFMPDPWFGYLLKDLDPSGYYPPGTNIVKRNIVKL